MNTHFLVCLALLFTLSGCGFARGDHKMLETADLIAPKTLKRASDVQLFQGEARPKVGCVKTAFIAANGNGYATREDLEAGLRQEAMVVGADVVIVGQQGQTSQTVGAYGGGIILSEQINFPYLVGVACRTGTIWHGIRFDPDQKGWIVRYVFDGSPAQKADIREGDEIVTVNGNFLGDDPFAWDREINAKSPSTTVQVQVIRSGNKQRLQLVLESPK
jgi:hypothetical protein